MIIRGKLRGHRWTCTFVENVIGLVKSILMRRWSKKGRGKRRHKLPHALKICNSKETRSGLASVHQLGINYCVSSCLEELSKRKWKRKWRRVFLGVGCFLLIFIVKIRVLLTLWNISEFWILENSSRITFRSLINSGIFQGSALNLTLFLYLYTGIIDSGGVVKLSRKTGSTIRHFTRL